MQKSLNRLRKKLGGLSEMGAHTEQAEGRLHAAAGERLDIVNGEIEKLRPRVATDGAAAARYERLILERGRLQMVLAQ